MDNVNITYPIFNNKSNMIVDLILCSNFIDGTRPCFKNTTAQNETFQDKRETFEEERVSTLKCGLFEDPDALLTVIVGIFVLQIIQILVSSFNKKHHVYYINQGNDGKKVINA